MSSVENFKKLQKKKKITILVLSILLVIAFFMSFFVGTGRLTFKEVIDALFLKGSSTNIRIIWRMRFPRILAALVAGSGLALSGVIMQANLRNPLASPTTLGVSNAAVFGANIGIVILGEGAIISSGLAVININNPYVLAICAFITSMLATFIVLSLSKFKRFTTEVVVLSGLAIGTLFTAGTTLIQYFAQDNSLSSAIFWSFGDLQRATLIEIAIMAAVIIISLVIFVIHKNSYNAMLFGDEVATSMGIKVEKVRFISLLLSSLITAVCISFLGIIGFIGIIAPHIMRRLVGNDHKYLIPSSMLLGALVLILSDMFARGVYASSSLPVGAITSLLGAPIFLWIIFSKKEAK